MIKIHPWPFGHQGAFAVRDDDTSYFTGPDLLRTIYARVWNKVPISFSVVPRIRATCDVPLPTKFKIDGGLYPVGKNESLCELLRDKLVEGTVSISQHGYTHESFNARPEFCLGDSAQLTCRIRAGKSLLEDTFGKPVRVFVPPHGRLSRKAGLAIVKERMCIARNCSYSQVFRSAASASNLPMLADLLLRNPFVWRHPIKPRLVPFKTHAEMVQSYMLDSDALGYDTLAEMKREFARVTLDEDLYYVTMHHWDFFAQGNEPNRRMLETLNAFVDFATQGGAWVTTLEAIAEWVEALGSIRVSRHGHEVRIASPRKIDGLAVSAEGTIRHNGLLREVARNKFILDLEKGEEAKIRVERGTSSFRS